MQICYPSVGVGDVLNIFIFWHFLIFFLVDFALTCFLLKIHLSVTVRSLRIDHFIAQMAFQVRK